MKIKPEEFELLKAWWAACVDRVMGIPKSLPAEQHPIAVLDKMAVRTPARARQGLAISLGDMVDQTSHWSTEAVAELDASLREAGLPTLTDIRRRFDKNVCAVIKRGLIRSEVEYYAVRNVVEAIDEEGQRQLVWGLLTAYEEGAR